MHDLTELWLEGSVMAVIHAAGAEQGYWVDESGLHHDDGSSNWWQLVPLGGGRAVVMGKDHELSGDVYDEIPQAVSDGPDWLGDAWENDGGGLRRTVTAKAPIGFFHWYDTDGTLDCLPADDEDDGSGLVGAPFSDGDPRLFESYYGVGDLQEAERFADALLDAARAGALTVDVLLPVLRCAAPDRTRPFDLESALKTAATAGLTAGSRAPELPAS
ncbi:hypothetical protein [Streptomyces sp. NPDC052114]|uniref:hypothetical protein n=1 Tax=unclassified Streptomyces TaxID=2593676 RepID=UPI00342BB111